MYNSCATSWRQAISCPVTNRKPRTVVVSQNLRKPEGSARESRRRADSRVKLLARRTHVFAQRMGGRWTVTHNSLLRRRTMKALASAMKKIKMETMPIAIAVEQRLGEGDRLRRR